MSNLSGTVLITGGTIGLGYQAALNIQQHQPNYKIIVASRTDPNKSALSLNQTPSSNGSAEFLPLDLSSLANVRSFAKSYASKANPPIKALVLNAGLQFPGDVSYTSDGIEKTFGINHVGHALLFYLLRPHLARDCRIVLTASGTHDPAQKTGMPDAKYTTAEEIAHPTAQTSKNPGRQRYSTSKLCNVLWTYALQRRLSTTDDQNPAGNNNNWTVTAMDPGLMPGTGLARDASPLLRFAFVHILPHLIPLLRIVVSKNIHSPRESGANLARLAVSDDVKDVSGVYFEGHREIKSSSESYNVDKQEDLWKWTIQAVALDEEEKRAFEEVYPPRT